MYCSKAIQGLFVLWSIPICGRDFIFGKTKRDRIYTQHISILLKRECMPY